MSAQRSSNVLSLTSAKAAPAPRKAVTLSPASAKPVQAAPVTVPAPAANTAPRTDDTVAIRDLVAGTATRIQHRAALIATYAALNGTEAQVRDIAEYLWASSPGDVSITSSTS